MKLELSFCGRVYLFFLLGVFISFSGGATEVTLDGTDTGRNFEGVGAVSAGGNSRLLIDYNEPYRSDILDYLFKPNYGAGFQHLKIEMGGGTNSTSGSVPSHAITSGEVSDPVSRGYQLWLMSEAKSRNSDLILDCLGWAFPYWFSGEFSQDTADYMTAFVDLAYTQWGLMLDYVGGTRNEGPGPSLWWLKYRLRSALDNAGYSNVKIQATESKNPRAWDIIDDLIASPHYAGVVDAATYHYIEDADAWPSSAQISYGISMWDSEQHVGGGTWDNAKDIVRTMNRDYIEGKITKQLIWCPVDSAGDGIFLGETGAMEADTPWSGHYEIRPALWGVAHYSQFTEPGWVFIEGGCGNLSGAGNYVTLKDPATGDYSIIIYADQAENFTFNLTGGLSTASVHVWKSDSVNQFYQLSDIQPSSGSFTISCDADSLYSLTTTTGQQKGQPNNPIPEKTLFPMPYSDNFESYSTGQMPAYLSDMQGTFQVENCKGGRSGKCVQQMVPEIGITWAYDWCNPSAPMTILSSESYWRDYEASIDVYIESGEVYLGVRKGPTQMFSGYNFVIDKQGKWRVMFDDVISDANVLETGTVTPFDGDIWHNITMKCTGSKIDIYLDKRILYSFEHSGRNHGQVCFGGSFDLNQYDNLTVKPAGPEWTMIDETGAFWSQWWWSYDNSEFFGGSCKFSNSVGQEGSFQFNGKRFRIFGSVRPDGGIGDVYVNRQKVGSFDCYAEEQDVHTLLYESDDMPVDTYRVGVKVSNDKNPSSTDHMLVIDAFAYTNQSEADCPDDSKTNHSLTASASASSIWSGEYSADKANDGESETRWNSAGGDVNGSWLEMDFGKEVTFDSVLISQYDSERIQSYKIQYYDGAWKDAYSGTLPGSQVINVFPHVRGTKARLLIVDAITSPSIYEFEVYSPDADLNQDGNVNISDLSLFSLRWLNDYCSLSCDCYGCDFAHNNKVNLEDFAVFAEYYID